MIKRFSELTSREKSIEVVRWLCVLPMAVIGSMGTPFIVGAVVRIVGYGGLGILGDSDAAYYLRVFLYYVPAKLVFVAAGALLAPRHPMATAIVLAVFAAVLSLMIHIVGQHLAGNRVGVVNYLHFAAELSGIFGGAAYIFWRTWRSRQSELAHDNV